MGGKVIFATGSFRGNLGTDADGNLFMDTHDKSKKIIFDGVKGFSGSAELDIDASTGKTIRTTIHDVASGTTFIRSGSGEGSTTGIGGGASTANQIQMKQAPGNCTITLSGSDPRFNIIDNDGAVIQRRRLTTLVSSGSYSAIWGLAGDNGGFQITPNIAFTDTKSLFISKSGHVGINTINTPEQLTISGSISASGDLYLEKGKYIYFGGEEDTQTSIRESNDNLRIEADDDILLYPDDDIKIGIAGTQYAWFEGDETRFRIEGDISASGAIEIDGAIQTDSHITSSGNIKSSGDFIGQDIWQEFPFALSSATSDRFYFRDTDDTTSNFTRWDDYTTDKTALNYRKTYGHYVVPQDCTLVSMRGVVGNSGGTVNPTITVLYGTVTEGTGDTTMVSASNGTDVTVSTMRVPYTFSESFPAGVDLTAGQIVIPTVKHGFGAASQTFVGSLTLRFKTR